MRTLLVLLLALAGLLPAAAQRGEDFASRYMALYGDRAALACKTISPAMMERIMKLDTVRHDAGTRRVFAQLRSIRFVTAPDTALTRQLYAQAEDLARHNRRRYAAYAERDNLSIYVRRRGNVLLELVVLLVDEKRQFNILNFTGTMSEDFIRQVLNI